MDLVKEASASKLAEVGLSDFDSDRLSAGYSGGMKRRLSLACATIGQPQIVFLDECSTGTLHSSENENWHHESANFIRLIYLLAWPPFSIKT